MNYAAGVPERLATGEKSACASAIGAGAVSACRAGKVLSSSAVSFPADYSYLSHAMKRLLAFLSVVAALSLAAARFGVDLAKKGAPASKPGPVR